MKHQSTVKFSFAFLFLFAVIFMLQAEENLRIRKASGESIGIITVKGQLIASVRVTDSTNEPGFTASSGDLRIRYGDSAKLLFSDYRIHAKRLFLPKTACPGYSAAFRINNIADTCREALVCSNGDFIIGDTAAISENDSGQPTYVRTYAKKYHGDPQPIISTTYFDGIGREIEAQLMYGSDSGLISGTYYDSIGRPVKQTKLACLRSPIGFYDMSNGALIDSVNRVNSDSHAFRQMRYDEDPLSRTNAIGMPGDTFSLAASHYTRVWNFGVPATNALIATCFDADCFVKANKLRDSCLDREIPALLSTLDTTGEALYYLSVTKDPNGAYTQRLIDIFGDVVKTWAYTSNDYSVHDTTKIVKARYIYDIESQVMEEVPPAARSAQNSDIASTRYTYGTRGQVIEKQTPDALTETYDYDSTGALTSMTKGDGTIIRFIYDNFGRVTAIQKKQGAVYVGKVQKFYDDTTGIVAFFGAGTVPKLDTVLGELDGLRGRPVADIATVSPDVYAIDLYSYNDDGKLGAKYKYIGYSGATGLGWQKTAYTYNLIGNLTAKTVYPNYRSATPPAPVVTRYDYDDANRMQALKNGSGKKIADYAYTPASLLDKRTYYDPSAAGTVTAATIDYDYNIRDWVTSIESRNPGGATNFRETLGYGGLYDGNIAVTMYRSQVGGSLQPLDLSYRYDGIKRLTAVTAFAGDTAFNEAFRYDNIGRIEQTRRGRDSIGSFTGNRYRYQDGTNRLLYVTTKHKDSTVASPNYAYDDNGNMQEDKSKRMVALYDWRDMPVAFTLRGDSANWAEVEMVYDAFGNRVLKIERKAAGTDTVAKAVAYIDGELEYETENLDTSAFTLTTAYYNGEGGAEGRITFDSATGAHTNYFVKDHLGSTRLMLAEDGAIEKVNAYYAYGKRVGLFNGPGFNKLRKEFTGKESDEEGASIAGNDGMNLMYFGARYFDPDICRWITVDPQAQCFDGYGYPNNPILVMDENGDVVPVVAIVVGALIAGLISGAVNAVAVANSPNGASKGQVATAFGVGFGAGLLGGLVGGFAGAGIGAALGSSLGGTATGAVSGALGGAIGGATTASLTTTGNAFAIEGQSWSSAISKGLQPGVLLTGAAWGAGVGLVGGMVGSAIVGQAAGSEAGAIAAGEAAVVRSAVSAIVKSTFGVGKMINKANQKNNQNIPQQSPLPQTQPQTQPKIQKQNLRNNIKTPTLILDVITAGGTTPVVVPAPAK